MKAKKVVALLMTSAMLAGLMVGCNKGGTTPVGGAGGNNGGSDDGILDIDMFIGMPGSEIDAGNDIQEIIAQKTGVRVKETWLTGQEVEQAIATIIASGDIPELMDGGNGSAMLYDEGLLIPWDEYLESGKYPNLKEMYSDEEWDRFRQDDGKIYWANIFQNTYGEPMGTTHNDEAFWIQVRVLEWAGYPKIETLDEYFDLIKRYIDANPTMDDGTQNIGYTCLTDGWRYFCIENAGQFLDGYPNDGSVIVNLDDPSNPKIVDYNTTDTTKEYLRQLNKAYNDGIMDKEFATRDYDSYIAALSSGAVLGMCDQWWDFAFTVNDVFKQQGLDLKGCNYVPLGLTIKPGMDQMWHTYGDTQNIASGVCVTTANEDPDRIFAFLNQLLDQEIHDLRFWGVEGEDYLVDENGLYYRTEEMRTKLSDTSYQASHMCAYSYLPQWGGTSRDGKNAMTPSEQPSEFKAGLAEPLRNCLDAYGARNYVDMIGSVKKDVGPWFPMYSHSNLMTDTSTPASTAWLKMGECKHEHLPKLVMASDFDSYWKTYMDAYEACDPQSFLDEMQAELNRRAGK